MAADTIVNFSVLFKLFDEEVLREKQVQLMKFATEIANGYIWQKDKFGLQLEISPSKSEYCLNGSVNCGDNIQDEWFIVYILFQISNSDHSLMISITDDDGQFLLIEAADYLPNWLNPDTSENRVYIHKGQLHVIPFPSNPAEVTMFPTGKPSIQEAIRIIFGDHGIEVNSRIQNSIDAKINRFDNGFSHLLHNAHCLLPPNLACILKKDPSVANRISDMLEQYVTANFGKRRKSVGKFEFKDWIISRVCFTKYTYAKLLHTNIENKGFVAEMQSGRKGASHKACDLGSKLAFGFELLRKEINKTEVPNQDICQAEEKWLKYETSLKNLGYFKGEIEGSTRWRQLFREAKDYFYATLPDDDQKNVWQSRNLRKLLEDSKKEVYSEEETLPEDDDSWLELSLDDVDKLLRGYHQATTSEDLNTKLDDVAQNMRRFVGKMSDYEGVETAEDNVDFDPSSIIEELKKIMDGKTENNRDEGDDFYESDSDQYYSDDENGIDDDEIAQIGSSMQQELRNTTLAKSFQSKSQTDGNGPIEDQSLDIDFNLVKNFLESVSAQDSSVGPVSNLLSSLGISLPSDDTVSGQYEE
ncbi:protein ecdysoneless homolog [Rhopilema esculentum]|uniref:protein ecdysoneless homolog n=1 Tax=Rhopilema esculentum TaxID=499914 RepID=UPI0031DD311C